MFRRIWKKLGNEIHRTRQLKWAGIEKYTKDDHFSPFLNLHILKTSELITMKSWYIIHIHTNFNKKLMKFKNSIS